MTSEVFHDLHSFWAKATPDFLQPPLDNGAGEAVVDLRFGS
ncbi:hypothetical protein [Shimia thalassica]|nr:hypothetical protein [Shimia thalassica]MDO6797472.1 hypothetical protein [Shimia thalassica]